MKQLTAAQQDFATEHHDLIYWFLHRRKLVDDEWYGVVAEAYLKAVMVFDPDKGAFTTIACRCMENAVRSEHHVRGYLKNKGITVNLDDELWNDGLKLKDTLPAPGCLEDDAIAAADFEMAKRMLSADQQRLLEMRMSGMSFTAIGEELDLSRQGAKNRVDAVIDKIRKMLCVGKENDMAQWKWMPHRKEKFDQLKAEGKPLEDIAKVLGCPLEIVEEYDRNPRPIVPHKKPQKKRVTPAVEKPAAEAPSIPELPAKTPLLHTLVQDSQELCQLAWGRYAEMDNTDFAYTLGQLQEKLNLAVSLLEK